MSRRRNTLLSPDNTRKGFFISGAARRICAAIDNIGPGLSLEDLENLKAVRNILLDPDWVCIPWHVDDIFTEAREHGHSLTHVQAREILYDVIGSHDCSIGINWDTIASVIDNYIDSEVDNNDENRPENT